MEQKVPQGPIKNVAIVGTGLVGCSWAIVFAKAGASVRLFDERAEVRDASISRIAQTLSDMRDAGLVDDPEAVLPRLTVHHSLDAVLDGVDYVQESVFERIDVKAAVCTQIGDRIGGDTVVGSSSSGLPASTFTEAVRNRERFLIAHPVNPPHIIPVVELVPAPWTAPGIIGWLSGEMTRVGQVPVRISSEVEGFVLNRLQGALLNEAWALYEEGYANLADIDATISQGLGLRWAFMGPFETIDLNAPGGISDYARRLGPLYHKIAGSRTKPRAWSSELIDKASAERRQALPLEQLQERSAWRDRRLMKLVAHLRRKE